LEVNVDQSNNVSWKGSHVLKDNKGSPKTEVKLKQKESGLGEFELTLGSDEQVKLDLKTKELVDKLELQAIIEGPDCGELKTTYQGCDTWATKVQAKMAKNNLTIDGQFSFASDNVTLGAQGVVDASDGTFTEYNVGIRLDQDKDRTYCLKSSDKFNEVCLAFYYQVNKDSEIGTQVDIDMGKGKIGIQAGGSYNLDCNSKLRYNLNSQADLALAYEYRFNNQVQGFLGTKYSLTDNALCEGFGYKLVFDC